MRYITTYRILLIGFSVVTLVTGTAMQNKETRAEFRDAKLAEMYLKGTQPLDVSLIQLIANPEKYEDKAVRVCGFYRVDDSDEDSCIYLSAEDSNYWMSKNGLWVRNNLSTLKGLNLNRKYILIEGIFDRKFMGHMDMNSGEIRVVWRAMALKKSYND